MKTIEVIKLASENSPHKAKSSLLRWEPASRSLLIRAGGQWRPATSLFGGVYIKYISWSGTDIFNRHHDRRALANLDEQWSKDRLCLSIPAQPPCGVSERTPEKFSMLRSVIQNAAPKVDGTLYWQWAFQYMLVCYCSAVRSAAATLDARLNALVTSTTYSQLSSELAALSESVHKGRVLNYASDCQAVMEKMDKVRQSFYGVSSVLATAYSDEDASRYSRPTIAARRMCVDDAGDWTASPYSSDFSIRIENPAKLIAHWSDLVSVLNRAGIEEPRPYGLTFSQDNIAAIASLIDVAKLDFAEPQTWRNAAKGVDSHITTPVSAMEFA